MLRTFLVAAHVAAGVVGLVAGLAAIPPERPTGLALRLRQTYPGCLAVLVAVLFALVVVDWAGLEPGARIAFAALGGVGVVMIYRVVRARREEAMGTPGWRVRYLGHIYFTYVSLWIGFLIIPALRLPLPQLSAPLVGIGVLTLGNVLISRYRRRLHADVRGDRVVAGRMEEGL